MQENDNAIHSQTGANRGDSASRSGQGRAGRLRRLCLKELRETLRDRRTIATLVLMPLLVYPLLSMAFQRFLFTSLDASREWVVGLDTPAASADIQRDLASGDRLLKEQTAGADGAPAAEQRPRISWRTGPALEQAVADALLDLAILVKKAPAAEATGEPSAGWRCELVYRPDSAASKAALEYVETRLRAVNDYALRLRLRQLGGEPNAPWATARRAVGSASAALSLTALVPLVLILMTITGAVYPAIDLTAGERERGTLESLMAAPVPRIGLLVAKYVAVLTVALLTAGANLAAMTVTLAATGLGEALFGQAGLSPLVIAEVFMLLILFAAFFSAVLLAVTSFARSFKEAQAYLIPLMLVSLAPGLMSLMPGLEFTGPLAVTPLVNIVLLARDLFGGTVDPALAVVAVVSTSLYAVAAIALAANVFGTDALLYGSEASWSDLLRRPAQRRAAASITGCTVCLIVLVPCCFVLSGLLARQSDLSIGGRLLANGVATILLFAGLPLVAAVVQRVRLIDGFQLRAPGPLAAVGAVLLGLAAWPVAHEVFLLNQAFGVTALGQQQAEYVERLLRAWRGVSPWLIVLALGIVPAVCEELCFRGYVLRALLERISAPAAIVVTALLFGAFHVVSTNVLTLERFLPSTFLGLILGWVCWRTGSVLPGMLLHACHNSLLLMVAYYRDWLLARGWGIQEQSHLPALWLAGAAVGILAGAAIMMVARPANESFRLSRQTPSSRSA